APARTGGAWPELARRLRLGLDYLRYLDPRYDATPHLMTRARERAPRVVIWASGLPGIRSGRGRQTFWAFLRALERGLPVSPEITAYFSAQQPDVVMITPLV